MPARLRARNPPVPIVVVERERIVPNRGCGCSTCPRGRRHKAHDGLERRALATGEDALERLHLAPVDGKPVGPADGDDPCREPALVSGGNPLGGILPAFLVPIHLGRREGEVAEVAAEAGLGVGVRGGSLARATFRLIRRAAAEIRDHGTFGYAAEQVPDSELCQFFAARQDPTAP